MAKRKKRKKPRQPVPQIWPKYTGWWVSGAVASLMIFVRDFIAALFAEALFAVAATILFCLLWHAHATSSDQRFLKKIAGAALTLVTLLLFALPFTIVPVTPSHNASARIKHSSTQVIQVSNKPGDYNESINLDNSGLLVQIGIADLSSITLGLTMWPSTIVDHPKRETPYQHGPLIFKHNLPPEVKTWGWSVKSVKQTFAFNVSGARSHVVEIVGRRFNVSLEAVRDRSTLTNPLPTEYTFLIREE